VEHDNDDTDLNLTTTITTTTTTTASITSPGGDDICLNIKRGVIEDLCRGSGGLYEGVQGACREAVLNAGLTPDQVEIVEVSDSSTSSSCRRRRNTTLHHRQ